MYPSRERMRFYYHFGQVNGSLNVGLRQKYNGSYTKIWEHKSMQRLLWKREVITINSKQQYEVRIQCNTPTCDFESGLCGWYSEKTNLMWQQRKAAENSGSTTAPLKDHSTNTPAGKHGSLSFSCIPANYTMCSFETNFCDWTQLNTDGFDWARGSAQTSPGSGLPKADHTTKIDKGEFWYQMSPGAKLSVHTRTVVGGHSERVTEITTATNRGWATQEITVEPSAAEAMIPFQVPRAFWGGIQVSDTSRNSSPAATCTFEENDCGWFENIPSDDFDWIRSSRNALPSNIQNQVPAQDHTTNTSDGHFMVILNNRSSISQIAALKSPQFSQSGTGCTMSFWYYNYGQAVGAAKMYLDVEGVLNRTVVWWTYITQTDRWQQAFVQLGRLHQPFCLSLVKVSLSIYDGVTAMDDIRFINCSLPQAAVSCNGPDHFWCKETRACIDRLHVCDLLDDCGDASDEENCRSNLLCDFENGLCNWEQATEDDFDWTRNRGQTPSLNTGPSKDHTFGTAQGHYFYIEVSEQQFGNTAMLVSPILEATTNNIHKTCIFRFHYHMFGMQIFRLAVHKRIYSNTKGAQLWVKYGNYGNAWRREVLFINSSQPFQILLEATVGDDFGGDIGIDDLSFMDCALHDGNLPSAVPTNPSTTIRPTTLPPHNCTENEFICKIDGQCVEIIKTCDFREDCSDKTDELACVGKVCNFHRGKTCGWKQQINSSAENTFQWLTGQGSTIHPSEADDRPSTDHTMGTEQGWYLYADTSNGEFGDSADIVTPAISQTGPMCKLVFWYHMNGVTIGTLQVFIKFDKVTRKLWSQSGSQGNQWALGVVFLGVQTSYQIILRATRGVSYMGDIAVDDISFQDCAPLLIPDRACSSDEYACANKYCIPKDWLCDFNNDCADHSDEHPVICDTVLGHCDFEFDMCTWRQLRDDAFDWTLKPGRTPSMGTGPATDHTLRDPSGHYIYIESSFPQLPGHVARISGPPISKQSKDCKILFYYHMAGHSIGSLIIYQVTVSDRRTMLFNLTGDQGNYWKRAKIPLSADEDFEILFEGWVGKGTKGDISLDDITFTKECIPSSIAFAEEPTVLPPTDFCPQGYLECQNGHCYQPKQKCDFVNNCGDNTDESKCGASCTFEDGQCGWKNSLADNFDWILGEGSFQSPRPSKDHTLGNENGHFMYLEATPVGLKGDKAHMKSSKWKESSVKCTLSFWYYTSRKASGLISVLIKTDRYLYKVWSGIGSQGDVWNKAYVPLKKLRNFEIIFEGIRTHDFGGGAAIDDIQFTNCTSEEYLPGFCPAVTDFICQNGQCIKSDLVCDYKPDCDDESDESDCSQFVNIPGSCSFDGPDTGFCISDCGLVQNTDDDFDWTIGYETISTETGPITDHTPGARGMFAYVNSLAQREGDIARITTTHHFPASLGVCHLRFWIYMYGSREMGTLKVYTVGENGMHLLMWAVTGNENRWKYVNVILSNNNPFQVAFEAEVGGDNLTDIAIDDISFSLECVSGGPIIPPPTNCTTDTFQCLVGPECIPLLWRCDDKEDCADGSDESKCPVQSPENPPTQQPCGEKEFRCSNEVCIPSLLRCDGVPDCLSAEDELTCRKSRSVFGAKNVVCEKLFITSGDDHIVGYSVTVNDYNVTTITTTELQIGTSTTPTLPPKKCNSC
uniref:MAM and LDL receptor class A domain containing 1 n=1 Tax=Callorhinchus milii TaxID=7868 RepID=A0A4W3GUH2_CALMI